ncbi:MAG: peptidylprolyl isomerase [Candidatus Heimdallarchaeota archaeon]|nr:peptidylprolyl isomerase [Candidatus Heimdallarchaeota archaeon]
MKDKDVVKFHYVGTFPDSGEIFDTSIEATAKEHGIHNPERDYRPLTVTIGEGQIIPGLEKALLDMALEETKTIDASAVDAYGEIDETRIMQLPKAPFGERDIDPEVGMMLQTEGGIATITEVNDETVTLDFNHVLAGKALRFEVTIAAIN